MSSGDDKKPRSKWIYARTAGEVDSIEVGVWSDGSGVEFVTPVEATHIQTEYDRAKRPKVLNKTPITRRKLQFSPNKALQDFNVLAAVDTNTRQINGRPISVAGVTLGDWVPDPEDSGLAVQYDVPFCMEFSPVCSAPERLGWLLCLGEFRRLSMVSPGARVGLIVDSELGNLDQYNSRELPILDQDYLPPDVTLVYASADSGSEYAANFLLRTSDKVAGQVLDRLMAGTPPPASPRYFGTPYSSLRRIRARRPGSG